MCLGVCEMPLYDSPQEVHVVGQLADLLGVTADQPTEIDVSEVQSTLEEARQQALQNGDYRQ